MKDLKQKKINDLKIKLRELYILCDSREKKEIVRFVNLFKTPETPKNIKQMQDKLKQMGRNASDKKRRTEDLTDEELSEIFS